jgi:CRP/FNR family cyclic AMP-dependent transcriptional regulator
MFVTAEETNHLQEYAHRSNNAFSRFVELTSLASSETLISTSDNLFSETDHKDCVYQILDGNASLARNHSSIITFEQGDLIGIEECFTAPLGAYVLNFAVRAKRFECCDIKNAISSSAEAAAAWVECITLRSAAFGFALVQTNSGEKVFEPTITTYFPGDVIIEQNSLGTDVFTLLSGHANVMVNGVQVGEIFADEIFGALAALSNQPRTATVVADKKSMVLSISKDQFSELIEARPNTVKKLVEDMARTIVALNSKVVAMSEKSPDEKIFR